MDKKNNFFTDILKSVKPTRKEIIIYRCKYLIGYILYIPVLIFNFFKECLNIFLEDQEPF